jgi:hypothetical protein
MIRASDSSNNFSNRSRASLRVVKAGIVPP